MHEKLVAAPMRILHLHLETGLAWFSISGGLAGLTVILLLLKH